MLQQILKDMWVDPEILAELDETQKQTLFCKMREEQVRRWQIWDQRTSAEPERPKFQKAIGITKHVQFMKGEDGEPWVWVMGEHPADQPVEVILAEEARREALQQARHEAHQLRQSVEKELTCLIDYPLLLPQKFDLSPKSVESLDELEIYCSVDELRQRIQALEPAGGGEPAGDQLAGGERGKQANTKLHFNFIEGKRDVLQDLAIPAVGDGVSHRVAAWERRVAAARAGDILRELRARRARTLRDAQLHAHDDDAAWREQERKAKEAEATMREIARTAREEHRRTSALSPPGAPAMPQAGKPPSKEAVVEWFRSSELSRGVGLEGGAPAAWFHGVVSRGEAEALLAPREAGAFLVRLSERVWGYALSLRLAARCKHFLVETGGTGYRLLGARDQTHASLADLIQYHKSVSITEPGELLQHACPPARPPALLCPPPS